MTGTNQMIAGDFKAPNVRFKFVFLLCHCVVLIPLRVWNSWNYLRHSLSFTLISWRALKTLIYNCHACKAKRYNIISATKINETSQTIFRVVGRISKRIIGRIIILTLTAVFSINSHCFSFCYVWKFQNKSPRWLWVLSLDIFRWNVHVLA